MEERNKSAIVSWIVPAIIFLLVVFVMMFNFSTKSSAAAADTVSRNLVKSAQASAEEFLDKLQTLGRVAGPFRVLLERGAEADGSDAAEVADVLYSCTEAYKVVLCDSQGNGVDQTGQQVSLGDSAYFQSVAQSGAASCAYVGEENAGEKPAVVVAERIVKAEETDYLLLYYSMDRFETLLSESEFDAGTFMVLMDSSGGIMGRAGYQDSNFLKGGNLLETIEGENAEATRTIRSRIDNSSRGTTSVAVGGEECVLVYVPLGVNQWEIVIGVSQAYVDRQVDLQWRDAKNMMIYLVAAIFVFIFMVIVINIISKIRSNENKKELEDKADTDLLTGLTNKLATERKIKEYMAKHPDSQSMLFVLDVDNFKKINDTMGHAFGDEVLRSLGQQITAIFRASDIIGRIGGDEFMIFLKGIADEESVRKEARKVENFFKNFQAGEYVKYAATASIGVAIFPQEGSDFESLYKAADQGLYKAKKRGKNQLAFYRDEWGGAAAQEQK